MIARDRIVELEDERNAAMAALAFCQDLAKAMIAERDEARARIAAALALCAEATSTEPYGGTKWTDDPYDAGLPLFVEAMADTLAGRPVTDTP